jgi:hypothetical protein
MAGGHFTLEEGMALLSEDLDAIAVTATETLLSATPMAESECMSDIAGASGRFVTNSLTTPVENGLSYAVVCGHSAIDSAKAIAHLLRHPDLLIWAPLAVARSGLDGAAKAFWLVEPGIGAERRVQRSMAVRLQSAQEMGRAPLTMPEPRERSKEIIAEIRQQATTLGWTTSGRDKPARVGTQEVPSPKKAIQSVLAHSGEHDVLAEMAPMLWWYFSGVTHAVPWALMEALARDEMVDLVGFPGMAQAPVMISGPRLISAAASLGRAALNLASAHARYLGFDGGRVPEVDASFDRTVAELLAGMEEAIRTGSDRE